VAVLVRKRLCNLITFCGCDDDVRVISVKLVCDNFHLLLFGCYFPCTDHTSNYCHILGDVLGYIEAVAMGHPGVRLCILGDLNFECDVSSQGYSLFRHLADDFGIVSCDYLISNDVPYTYHHVSLQHKSFIDHVFISQDLKSYIRNFAILENVSNI
jgi:hypothetical protein